MDVKYGNNLSYVREILMNTNVTVPLLPGNEPTSESMRVINLIFATYSLRASMVVLLFICSVVIYHILFLVIKDLWRAHREVAASLGLDQCDFSYLKECIERSIARYCATWKSKD